jgi:O-methyltransferase
LGSRGDCIWNQLFPLKSSDYADFKLVLNGYFAFGLLLSVTSIQIRRHMIKAAVLRLFNSMGYQVVRSHVSFSTEELTIIRQVREFTSSSAERIVGLMNAMKYVVSNRIPGSFVECGVWRGGSSMVAAYTLKNLGDTSRDLYLFDTFEGMSDPTEADVMFDGQKASKLLAESKRVEGPANYWCIAGLEDVKTNLGATGYPSEKVHFVRGKVEDTIPNQAPKQISVLRLDTDWYESTAHELEHLYPLVSPQGIVIIDDYGHWQGARKAVDEYFARQPFRPLLNRLDYTGRLLIKS